jgi:hypothetical protein
MCENDARRCAAAVRDAIFQSGNHRPYPPMRIRSRKVLTIFLALFLFPVAVHAALYASKDHPASFRDANWSSVGMLPLATADRDARLLVFTGRTGRWKGVFAVHSWVVFKPENATSWSRYDVVGWGQPVRSNGWAPDGRWFGDTPRVLVDVRGATASALIPKVKAAIADYTYGNAGDYRVWPGPNSNTFTATRGLCLRQSLSRRSGAAGSIRCRSMSAIAATRAACIVMSMRVPIAPRKCPLRSPTSCSTFWSAGASPPSTSPVARPSSIRSSAAW